MSKTNEQPNIKATLDIVSPQFWEEQTDFYNKDKDIVDTIGYATKWGLNMQNLMSLHNTPLTKELAEKAKPFLEEAHRMTYQLMIKAAQELLYAAWAYGEDLAKAYGEDMRKIKAFRNYARDENAKNRKHIPSWRDIEEADKRRYLKEKKAREQQFIQMDEELLASLKDEKIEFKDEKKLEKFFQQHHDSQRSVTLFIKLCQYLMRKENTSVLSESIIKAAKSQIHSTFTENTETEHAIITSWKHGVNYARYQGYTETRISKILQPPSPVTIHNQNGR